MPRAVKRPAKTFGGWVVVVRTPAANYLRLLAGFPSDRGKHGVWLNLSPSRDFAPKNTAHAWTDGPLPATFTVP